jgi:hypothetical protein
VAEREGYLVDGKIPPLLITWWDYFEVSTSSEASAALVHAANNFVSLSDVRDGASHGKPFERQLAHLWRILTVTDRIWREEQPGDRRPRTVLGMLGKGCIDVLSSVENLSDTEAAFNCALAEVESNYLCHEFAHVTKPANIPTDVPATLQVGMTYFPVDPQNPGFDFAIVDRFAYSAKTLVTLVEAKFSGENVQSRLSRKEIIDKFVLALQGRPNVQRCFVERRLCYVIGGLRRVQDSVMTNRAELISAIADSLPACKGLPRKQAARRDLVACTLVVLDRPHVKLLLTPTLSSLPPFSDTLEED